MSDIKDRYLVTIGEHEFDLELQPLDKGFVIKSNGSEYQVDVDQLTEHKYLLRINNNSLEADITRNGGSLEIFMDGRDEKVRVESFHVAELRKRAGSSSDGPEDKTIFAPMPGLVLSNEVAVGDKVSKGQTLLIIEAMKMENLIKSPSDGVVKEIFVEPSHAVDKNDKLLELE